MYYLGKKEMVIIIVVLILFSIYFVAEFLLNKKAVLKETFQSEMNNFKLEKIKDCNQILFKTLTNINLEEIKLYKNELSITNLLIKKKYNIDQFIKSTKYIKYLNERKVLLDRLKENLIISLDNINDILDISNNSELIYYHLSIIINSFSNIYNDNIKYFDEYNLLNLEISTLDENYKKELKKQLTESKVIFSENIQRVEDSCQQIITYIDNDVNVNKNLGNVLKNILNNKKKMIKKMVVRQISFDLIETIIVLLISYDGDGNLSEVIDKKLAKSQSNRNRDEMAKQAKASNKVLEELFTLFEIEKELLEKIYSKDTESGLLLKTSSFSREDNEFQYLKNKDSENENLIKFCKKMRQLDKPRNNSLMFDRLSKNFIEKKDNKIKELHNNIDNMIKEMTLKDNYNQDLYLLRTNEEAKKQVNAIDQAKQNIDSLGKFKINIK